MKILYENFQAKTVRFDESADFQNSKIDSMSFPGTSVPEISRPTSLETTVSFAKLDFFLH